VAAFIILIIVAALFSVSVCKTFQEYILLSSSQLSKSVKIVL
jgi:hypothetical protein